MKEQVFICDFSVLDSEGKDCYEVTVGKEYTILTCLCEECRHMFRECATDKGISGRSLSLEWGEISIQIFPDTDSSGNTEILWICPNVVEEGYHILKAVSEEDELYYEASSGRDLIVHKVCEEGKRDCRDYDLYECVSGEWELIEHNSTECGYIPPTPCPIMCICYGTPLVDALGPLRVFRDKVLRRFGLGKWFISFYYNQLTPLISPVILKLREVHCYPSFLNR